MREILFRGKAKNSGVWVQGKLLTNERIIIISDEEVEKMPCFDMCDYQTLIDIKTLGQYTGLKDKNGTKIFEGDIITFNKGRNLPNYICRNYLVEWDERNVCFTRQNDISYKTLQKDMMVECEVIGNVYDNPELLEKVGD